MGQESSPSIAGGAMHTMDDKCRHELPGMGNSQYQQQQQQYYQESQDSSHFGGAGKRSVRFDGGSNASLSQGSPEQPRWDM